MPTVESVTQFIEHIQGLPRRATSIHCFRGQRNHEWIDDPALLRKPAELLPYEYNSVRDLVAVHPQEFYQDENMFDRLVRMQHYGLPTRLMDVTTNPLVALYFATEPYRSTNREVRDRVIIYDVPKIRRKYYDSDSVSCVANLANLSDDEKQQLLENEHLELEDFNDLPASDRLVQLIKSEKPHFRKEIKPLDLSRAYYVVPKMQNRRIIAQHGSFIIFGLKIKRLKNSKSSEHAISKSIIDIPQGFKAVIRRQLDQLGINNSALFPDLNHAALDIVRKYTQ